MSAGGVHLSDDVFARLVGRAGDVLLFEVAVDFAKSEWTGPVKFRFVRTEGGLLSMEMRDVTVDAPEVADPGSEL